jgi:hypothetical protein
MRLFWFAVCVSRVFGAAYLRLSAAALSSSAPADEEGGAASVRLNTGALMPLLALGTGGSANASNKLSVAQVVCPLP